MTPVHTLVLAGRARAQEKPPSALKFYASHTCVSARMDSGLMYVHTVCNMYKCPYRAVSESCNAIVRVFSSVTAFTPFDVDGMENADVGM